MISSVISFDATKIIFQQCKCNMPVMVVGVVEFSREGHKIRKVFAKESTYPKEIIEF